MAHAYNPSYSTIFLLEEGRDQEDHSSNSSFQANTQHQKGLVEWLKW
jgi:hypothetical protein